MHVLTADGIRLAYDSYGQETDETMLLIAGLGTQRIRWTPAFCEALAAQGFRVICFDNRDTGGSTHFTQLPAPQFGALAAALMAGQRPQVPYTLHDMAADAVGLLDALGIERVHVVGRSMGGMIAQILASEHAERVLSLTSIMSSTGNPALPAASPEVMALMMRPAPDPTNDEAGFVAHSLAFARCIAGTGFSFDEQAHRTIVREEIRRGYAPGGFARHVAAMAVAGDRRARLATIKAPTLVIHGAEDPLILPACGEDTARSIPGAEFMPIDGMGHELPKETYAIVIDSIARTARRATRAA
ncbi:alpha/beta hydrolase [Dyella sp. GSA-30]|uniref:alpha/beta fold hydrolase n=1 Tax=Dyella sp. GSA-30 TaxID=2994496 RepID=UPI002492BA38|nr:alpha/beta hydrolase [Dyella sp. GSA-30]BDU22180.1 alpha/beta hydrolase [Dyella sp. GSA-30]